VIASELGATGEGDSTRHYRRP